MNTERTAFYPLRRFAAAFIALLLLLCAAAVCTPFANADEAFNVSSSAQLSAALSDPSVSAIHITANVNLDAMATVSRALTITGTGAVLSFSDGACIVSTSALSVSGVTLQSNSGYAIVAKGSLTLGNGLVIGGKYGVRLDGGSSATSAGKQILVAQSVERAIGIECASGRVSINDLLITQDIGAAAMLYLHPSTGDIVIGGTTRILASAGCGIVCPAGGSCPRVFISDNSSVMVSSPNASNDQYAGAAVDVRGSSFTVGKNATVELIGSENGVIASAITLDNNSVTKILCMKEGTAAQSGSGSAALWCGGKLSLGTSVTVTVGATQSSCSNGIYSSESLTFPDGFSFTMRGSGGQHAAICTPDTMVFGNGCSVVVKQVKNALLCDNGLTTGDKCTFDFSDISSFGIRALGKLQANKIFFGTANTIDIQSAHCSIYTCESVDISEGSTVDLTGGSSAPALWIDADTDSQGHLTVISSQVNISGSAAVNSDHNSAVYCVGPITIDGACDFRSINPDGFGMLSAYGDINISNGAKVYTSGGCGMYLLDGNLRLTSGGALYAEGLVDSGLRTSQGVVNAGEGTTLDVQGARFGVEVLSNGGVWLSGAVNFDIRSTGDRAVYVENGSLNVEQVERLSVWQRAEDSNNSARWWNTAPASGLHSWEALASLTEAQRTYADYTTLSPTGTQNYVGGTATNYSGFDLINTSWNADSYSRIGMYYSLPVARANTFFIPAGRSFSWWLYGEGYDGVEPTFHLVDSQGEGDFVLGENGRFTYYAPSYTRGMQYFSFIVRDGSGLESLPVTVSIKVTASKPPIVSGATFKTASSEPLIGSLTMNDYDGLIANTEIVEEPQHGDLLISSDGQFSYKPDYDFVGIDTFAYKAIDSMGDESNIGYVSVVVGAEEGDLYACNDTIITESGVAASARLAILELSAPTEEQDGEAAEDVQATIETEQPALSYIITQQPQYGILTFIEKDIIQYAPYEDFSGSDILKYVIVDEQGNRSNEAIVTIATIPNQRPAATVSAYSCYRGSACKGTLQAQDVDGTIMRYDIVAEPEFGSVKLNNANGEFTYRAPFGKSGKVYFTFVAVDNDGLSSYETIVEIEVLSLYEYLVKTDKLRSVVIASTGVLLSLIIIVTVLLTGHMRRRKEQQLEAEREKLLDYISKQQNLNK